MEKKVRFTARMSHTVSDRHVDCQLCKLAVSVAENSVTELLGKEVAERVGSEMVRTMSRILIETGDIDQAVAEARKLAFVTHSIKDAVKLAVGFAVDTHMIGRVIISDSRYRIQEIPDNVTIIITNDVVLSVALRDKYPLRRVMLSVNDEVYDKKYN